jgi:molybdenum cofactor cytidylyltransferase
MKATAILLAAGKSTRMGSPKGVLPWQGQTLFEHQLLTLEKSLIDEIIVVVGYQANLFLNLGKNHPIKTAYNKNFLSGKCSSILTGLQSVSNHPDAILFIAVDQPSNPHIIDTLIKALFKSDRRIAVPVYHGKRGHPVLFSASLIGDLLSIKEETMGLRSVFQKHKESIYEVPIDNAMIRLNLNTPQDYEAAVKKLNWR